MTTWRNADGLVIAFGTSQGEPAVTGEVHMEGGLHKMLINLTAEDLPAAGAGATRLDPLPTSAIPSGVVIESCTLKVDEAFVGVGATLDIGLAEEDGTEIDFNGLIAAAATTDMDSVGDTVAGAGASVGAALTEIGFVTATVTSADFTDGSAAIEIVYRKQR
jgi:hypothetical protein